MAKFESHPVTWNGKKYRSIKQASIELYVCYSAMRARILKGYTCDDDLYSPLRKPVIWNGVQYPSIGSAADALGICYQAVIWRLRQGYTCDEDMQYSHTSTPR